jgi:Family of unknown function (DUF6090)
MAKLFNKMRKTLVSEKPSARRTSNYLKYAIGEIILVVIGILIALQINNWNEQKKENALEQEYYCRLLEDVVQDQENVNDLIVVAQNRLKAANQAIRLLKDNNTNKTDVGKELGIAIEAIVSDFSPNNSAFEDLKSGANLNIIKDKSVIRAINNYFKSVEALIRIIRVNGDVALDRFFSHNDKFAMGWVNSMMQNNRFINGLEKDVYESMQIDNEELVSKDMKFRLLNDAVTYISSNSRQIELYNFIKDEISILRELLESKCVKIND